ncbi:hypothetical protein HLB23_34680 [Nocardia uniformis]|uniref:DUF8020 domain-containing protein n=1 Tax=Nocardia uniformis TaxID=53432 RepID=A0A849CB53_9NOCA|nr:hypothetical protein [Nocardia uniformis]NNH74938.1 hypothetical protein [Nocardia uniformis]
MFIKRMVATAVFAIAATGITMTTAHGQAGLSVSAVDGSVGYTTTLAADHSNALITLASGRFVLTPDAVQVVADNGVVVGAIPTTLRAETGGNFAVTPTLNSETELTLTPVGGPTPAAAAVSSQDLPFVHTAGGAGAIFAGAVVGCVVGILIGIWFFLVGAIIGCAIGAAIGGWVGAVS